MADRRQCCRIEATDTASTASLQRHSSEKSLFCLNPPYADDGFSPPEHGLTQDFGINGGVSNRSLIPIGLAAFGWFRIFRKLVFRFSNPPSLFHSFLGAQPILRNDETAQGTQKRDTGHPRHRLNRKDDEASPASRHSFIIQRSSRPLLKLIYDHLLKTSDRRTFSKILSMRLRLTPI